jgi:hypothetical protein
MFGFAALAYVQRTTIAVAAPELTTALQLSKQQIGWLFLAFTAAYAAAQLPGGALGQRFGPRAVFTGVGLLGVVATLATARVVLGPKVRLQATPNLVDLEECRALLGAGVDDWGGVSPLTPDHVNPERPWPSLDRLREVTAEAGLQLRARLTVHQHQWGVIVRVRFKHCSQTAVELQYGFRPPDKYCFRTHSCIQSSSSCLNIHLEPMGG